MSIKCSYGADECRDTVPASDAAEGVREQAQELYRAVCHLDASSAIDRIAAFVQERERATIARIVTPDRDARELADIWAQTWPTHEALNLAELQDLANRITAYGDERERVAVEQTRAECMESAVRIAGEEMERAVIAAVEAEREANCKEMCRHCCKAYPTVSDHGFWRHDLGAGQFAFCDASPIRARKQEGEQR